MLYANKILKKNYKQFFSIICSKESLYLECSGKDSVIFDLEKQSDREKLR